MKLKTRQPDMQCKKYVPDIAAFISLCDTNYARLMKLLPFFELKDAQCFGLAKGQSEFGQIQIEITERCKYTTTLTLRQYFCSSDADLLAAPEMQVRMYHDAMMAEVLSFQGEGKLKGFNNYPNARMHQKAEKALCNQFLSEWLSYCQRHAYASEQDADEFFAKGKGL